MNLCMLVDKPMPSERPTGIGVAAFNMALYLSKHHKVEFICRGVVDQVQELNDNFTIRTLRRYSRDNVSVLSRILRQDRCDLIHIHSSAAFPSLVLAKASRKKIVVHSHGAEGLHPIRLTLIRNASMVLCDRVIAVSKDTRAKVSR